MSLIAERVCEPHYSKQLDSTSDALHKSSPIATLDNPAVLDQQLAALCHRKRQLEEKGICLKQQNRSEKLLSDVVNFPKFSPYSLETQDCTSNIIYSNAHISSSFVDSKAIDANVSELPNDAENIINSLSQTKPSEYIGEKPDINPIKNTESGEITQTRTKIHSKFTCKKNKKGRFKYLFILAIKKGRW